MVPELWEMAATELAALVQAGKASCREVVQAHLDRISQVNQLLNAVTVPLAEKALTAAEAADRAFRRGEPSGPLSGVPMTVKENIDVAGSATTLGIAPLRDAVASHDAPHIGELRAAGAIPVGRTNMPEFGMRWHTVSALRGATLNPWSAGHTPGGSSGGDAAAVASGMAPLGMGNDGAGSLRWPAACCGVAALKPSFGRVSQGGYQEPPRPAPFAFQLLAVHGPIARHVGDLRLAFRQMCGRSGGDPWYAPVPLDGPPVPAPLRVSVITDTGGDPADHAVTAAVRQAAALLADAGYVVADDEPPAVERAAEIYYQIMTGYGRAAERLPPVESVAPGEFARFWQAFAGLDGRGGRARVRPDDGAGRHRTRLGHLDAACAADSGAGMHPAGVSGRRRPRLVVAGWLAGGHQDQRDREPAWPARGHRAGWPARRPADWRADHRAAIPRRPLPGRRGGGRGGRRIAHPDRPPNSAGRARRQSSGILSRKSQALVTPPTRPASTAGIIQYSPPPALSRKDTPATATSTAVTRFGEARSM